MKFPMNVSQGGESSSERARAPNFPLRIGPTGLSLISLNYSRHQSLTPHSLDSSAPGASILRCTPTVKRRGIRPCTAMQFRARGFCKKRDLAAGLGVMLVDEGGADGEAGGDSPSSSAKLQLVGVLRRGKCSGVAAAAGWEGTTGGTRGLLRWVGLLRLNPGQPTVREVGVGLCRR